MPAKNAYLIAVYLIDVWGIALVLAVALSPSNLGTDGVGVASTVLWATFVAVLIVQTVTGVRVIVDALRRSRRHDGAGLRSSLITLKFGLIPFFIVNFVLWALFNVLVIAASRGLGIFMTPAYIAAAVVLTYLAMVPSSVYGICWIRLLRSAGQLDKGGATRHTVMQLIFVLDVISAAILMRRYRYPPLSGAPTS